MNRGNKIFIIMEHIEGSTLRECLEEEREKVCKYHNRIFLKICKILQEINYEHRDIKPENIILTKYPNGFFKDVFLIDFGLASLYPFADEGTLMYQAPEQKIEMSQSIKAQKGSKIDIFACGILLCEMIMGKAPIEGINFSMYEESQEWTIFEELAKKGVQQEEINFIRKCLQINPKDRFGTKKDMCYSYTKIK